MCERGTNSFFTGLIMSDMCVILIGFGMNKHDIKVAIHEIQPWQATHIEGLGQRNSQGFSIDESMSNVCLN